MHRNSHNKPVSVSSQCLAVVLTRDGATTANQSNTASAKFGAKVFQSFVDANSESFWNPAIVESVKSLDYVGFMKPSTLLVSGSELHLECLRGAWARRVLKPPQGFQVKSLGDIEGFEIQEVPQTQFVPLPEVLCLVISQLNRTGLPATLVTIAQEIAAQYHGMTVPGPEILLAALTGLGSEGKVYCMGDHFFVATPWMAQQYRQSVFGGGAGPAPGPSSGGAPPPFWPSDSAPYHVGTAAMCPAAGSSKGQDVAANPKPNMVEMQCQTGASIVNAPAYKPTIGVKANVRTSKREQATLADVPELPCQKEEKGDPRKVQRSRSLKDKDKKNGGFFSRLFKGGSNSGKEQQQQQRAQKQPPALDNLVDVRSRSGSMGKKSRDSSSQGTKDSQPAQPTKYPATFSAQFPPTEWLFDPRMLAQQTAISKGISRKRDKVGAKNCLLDKEKLKNANTPDASKFTPHRFCTFPENLNEESPVHDHRAVAASSSRRKSQIPAINNNNINHNYHHNHNSNRNYQQRRLSKYLSSSSECLNYGPVDPPEFWPKYTEQEDGDVFVDDLTAGSRRRENRDKQRHHRKHHRRSERVCPPLSAGGRAFDISRGGGNNALPTLHNQDSTLRQLEDLDSADDPTPQAHNDSNLLDTSTEIPHSRGGRTSTPVEGIAPSLLPVPTEKISRRKETDNFVPDLSREAVHNLDASPGQPIGSDSAYSPSPAVTDNTSSSHSTGDKFSSWSGSEGCPKEAARMTMSPFDEGKPDTLSHFDNGKPDISGHFDQRKPDSLDLSDPMDHTYMNLDHHRRNCHHDSTKFENITYSVAEMSKKFSESNSFMISNNGSGNSNDDKSGSNNSTNNNKSQDDRRTVKSVHISNV